MSFWPTGNIDRNSQTQKGPQCNVYVEPISTCNMAPLSITDSLIPHILSTSGWFYYYPYGLLLRNSSEVPAAQRPYDVLYMVYLPHILFTSGCSDEKITRQLQVGRRDLDNRVEQLEVSTKAELRAEPLDESRLFGGVQELV